MLPHCPKPFPLPEDPSADLVDNPADPDGEECYPMAEHNPQALPNLSL
jgi:hypothetical protein